MRRVAKIFIRFAVIFFLLLSVFLLFVLNPQIIYGNKHTYNTVTIYSQQAYDTAYNKVIDKAIALVKNSELYDSTFHLYMFLNDGSLFPKLLKDIYGDAYAWGYHDNVILNGTPDGTLQWIYLNGYNRQMARTIAHEMIHCYQYNALGLFHSRPLRNIPVWKWEGYAEYVAYKSSKKDEYNMLIENIGRLIAFENEQYLYAETIVDEGPSFVGTGYLKYWVMVKYLMDIKHLSYKEILKDTTSEAAIYGEMLKWYNGLNI